VFSEFQLLELSKTFRARLPDDSGVAQLGLLLIQEVRVSRTAVVSATEPLEALAANVAILPSETREGVLRACSAMESALESHQCKDALNDSSIEMLLCDFDSDACEDSTEYREYFQSAQSDEHLFKFTLHPDGEFKLHTYLNDTASFWKRLWRGIRYAFGATTKNGHWDTVNIDRSMTERLHRLTNEALDSMSGGTVSTLTAAE
jgi:hypothetical protein